MALSFGIIGGGWYGCHIASSLRTLGFGVTIFERHARLLHCSSGNNQFRLHLGFHYPRHYGTRMQSREGFSRFVERYPALSRPVVDNIYAVPRGDSLIDFLTYKLIMTSSGIEFAELSDHPAVLASMEGCLQAPERVLLIDRARRYFTDRLEGNLVLGHRVTTIEETDGAVHVDGHRFDFLIDATWGHFTKPPMELFYEPTLLLYYEANCDFPAITLVDGPLCSIYPTEDRGLYTLSSVPYTPLGHCSTSEASRYTLDAVDTTLIAGKVELMERQISRYVPCFNDVFRYIGPQLSVKSKPTGSFDDRSCYVFKVGRIFSVMSGKIDTIFYAVERILSLLETMPDASAWPESGSLRKEVLRSAASLVLI